MTFSAEQAAELAATVLNVAVPLHKGGFFIRYDELASVVNAAVSQQAAPGVAGGWRCVAPPCKCTSDNFKQCAYSVASQPHPTGDAQQEAVQESGPWKAGVNDTDGRTYVESDDFTHDVRLYVDGDFYDPAQKAAYAEEIANRLNGITHPPEATALAQEVKDKAVEICYQNMQRCKEYAEKYGDDTAEAYAVSKKLFEAIAAIPIPEPRPDALVAMAYRNAAEVCRELGLNGVANDVGVFNAARIFDCVVAIYALTPPEAKAALEELVYAAVCAGQYAEINDSNPVEPQLRFVARATLNQQNGKD